MSRRADELLSLQQAADIAGVTAEAVRLWIHAGKLDALRIGGRFAVTRVTIEGYARRRKEGTP